MGDTSRNVLNLRTEKLEQIEAVPVVAAETIVTKCLKVVDDAGNVRVEASVHPAGDRGTGLRLFDHDGHCLVELLIIEGGRHHGLTSLFMGDQHTDSHASICVGSLRGPAVSLEHEKGISCTMSAEREAGLVEARAKGEASVMQLVPGEEPATFVEQRDDAESVVAS